MRSKEVNLTLDVVILIIGGMAMLITGGLLFPVYDGKLPYYENGLYGLLLLIFALQMITLGKTPFGDMPRSKLLFALGTLIAAVGMATCFIPIVTPLPRILLLLCFAPGGLLLLLQTCWAKDKLRSWATYGGVFWHLIIGCSAVYVLSMFIGLLLWKQSLLSKPLMALTILLFGVAILYLAGALWKIYRKYPEAQQHPVGDIELSTDQAMLILMGVFLLMLGALLILANLGLLPFSISAQLGLLTVIFAVQTLASGSTPIGILPRSWPVVGLALFFAALGIVSCVIPDILVFPLTCIVGALNLLGGGTALIKMGVHRYRHADKPSELTPALLVRLFATQLTMNLLTVMFGASMLIPGLIHGPAIGVILVANGCVLLYLLRILIALDIMQADLQAAI